MSFLKRIFSSSSIKQDLRIDCPICGGNSLLKITIDKLNPESQFQGTLPVCSKCEQIFPDFITITPDKQIFPNDAWHALQQGESFISSEKFRSAAHIIPDHLPPKCNTYKVILGRDFQSSVGIAFLKEIVLILLCMHNTSRSKKFQPLLSFGIDGWDNDPRELWQIPEIASFFWKIHSTYCAFPLWFTAEYIPLYIKVVAAGAPDEWIKKWWETFKFSVTNSFPKTCEEKAGDIRVLISVASEALFGTSPYLINTFGNSAEKDEALQRTTLWKFYEKFHSTLS